jgi:membrane protein DedA with SNARE-associated domain
MLDWVRELIEHYGYAIVVVLVMAEGLGLPLPGETALLTAAAFSAHSRRLSIIGVVLASVVGGTAGGLGGYWIGRKGGLPFLTRYGRHIGITPERIAQSRKFFTEHGPKAVFAGRFVAIVRFFAGLLAGVTHMRFWVFFLWNALGALAWSVLFGALGYVFGNNLPRLERLVGRTGLILLGVAVLGALIAWHFRRSKRAAHAK